jgi:hypothetical protein
MRRNNKLTEEQIRSWVRMELFRSRVGLIKEQQEGSLYNIFVGPFEDVVIATGLAGQDILNISKLTFDSLITFSPSKLEAKRKEYESRKGKIQAKWQPLMDRTKQAMGEDAQLLAFGLNPAGFMGAKLASGVPKTAKNMNQYLHDSGWSLPLLSSLPGFKPSKDSDWKEADQGGSKIVKGVKDLAGELAKLFFIAHHAPEGPMLSEAEEEGEKVAPAEGITNFKKDFEAWLEESGVGDEFKKTAAEIVDNKNDQIQSVLDEAIPKFEMLTALASANDYDQFEKVLDSFAQSGGEVDPGQIATVKKMITDGAKELAASQDFKDQLAKEKKSGGEGEDAPKVSDQEIAAAAKKVAFVNAKQSLQKQLASGIGKLKDTAIEELKYDLPEEESDLKIMGKSPQGKELLNAIKVATDKINSYNIQV